MRIKRAFVSVLVLVATILSFSHFAESSTMDGSSKPTHNGCSEQSCLEQESSSKSTRSIKVRVRLGQSFRSDFS